MIKTCLIVCLLALGACTSAEERPMSTTQSSSSAGIADGGGGSGSGGSGGASPEYPAIEPPIPRATNHGGVILTSPKIFTVVFDGDPLAQPIIDFDAGITSTPWWTRTTAEYCQPTAPTQCIGPGTTIGSASLGTALASYTDADVQSLIQAHVLDGSFPAPDPETIYAFYFPFGTNVIELPGQVSCQAFHAYHQRTSIAPAGGGANVTVAYLIVTRCADANGIDGATLLGSHELIEAATDPHLDGYYVDDIAWAATHGGELADLCLYSGRTTQGTWAVERGFSSAAALQGTDPCVPEDGAIDFNLAPASGVSRVKIAPGKTATLDLVAYSSAPLGDWSVEAVNTATGEPLTLSLDQSLVHNGSHATLTITLGAGAVGLMPFMIRSTRGDRNHFWPGVVIPTP